MLDEMRQAPEIVRPSSFWEEMNQVNLQELENAGLESFKQTVNTHYFQFLPADPRNEQFRAMMRFWARNPSRTPLSARLTDPDSLPASRFAARLVRRQKKIAYPIYVALLWEYVRRHDKLGLLERLEEPELGRPVSVEYRGRRISEDLCNSVLELSSVVQALPSARVEPSLAIELGSGYGRLAWVFLEAFPDMRYVLVDIPVALAVAEEYMAMLFPDRRIFRFRHFDRQAEVREELDAAQIAFLTPNQLDIVDPLGAGLFVNVSSLHEMTPAQIRHYVERVGVHCRGFFYTKQWVRSVNRKDGVVIRREDYPIPAGWVPVFDRRHPVQTRFFEALYRLPGMSG